MTQNTSAAVMQQRREPHKSLDDFPTPPWATRALCEWLIRNGEALAFQSCREPAANRGHMVRPLLEFFGMIEASDVHDYGAGYAQRDYLFGPLPDVADWTVTNPPFRLAEDFIDRARRSSTRGAAMLVRSAFLEGGGRWHRIFRDTPPTDVLQFSERVVMHKGKLTATGSTATAYCWMVWRRRLKPGQTRLDWIPPGTRKRLERADDYT